MPYIYVTMRTRTTRPPSKAPQKREHKHPHIVLYRETIERWAACGDDAAYWEEVLFQFDDMTETEGREPQCQFVPPLRDVRESRVELVLV